MATSSAHTQRVPCIKHLRILKGKPNVSLLWLTLVTLLTVNLWNEYQPVTMMATAHERPLATQAVPALGRHRFASRCKRPGEDRTGVSVEDLSRAIVGQPRKVCMPAHRDLQVPSGSAIDARDLLNDAEYR